MNEFKWPGWVNRNLWPQVDPDGLVFAGRAFDRIGAALFSDWTGREIEEAESAPLRRIPIAEQAFKDGAARYGIHREFGPLVVAAAGGGHPSHEPIPPALWSAVAKHNNLAFDAAIFAKSRRDTVVVECHRLALAGVIQFAARKRGGDEAAFPVAPEQWEIDYPWVPFATLGYGNALGLSSPAPTHWLFVTAQSLEVALGLPMTASAYPRAVFGLPTPNDAPDDSSASPDEPRHEAVLQLAAKLDAEGVPIRGVSRKHVEDRWAKSDGPNPLVKVVTGYMNGGGKGGRKPG